MLRSGSTAAMVHIGDSRAYLLRDGVLHQVTTDHTFVQFLVDTGQITPEEAETHPQRSIILRALGDNSTALDLDTTVRQLNVGERWLLCSDGLSGMVSYDTIAETLNEVNDVGECADRLLDLALRAGGQDNVTVILADIVDASTPTDNAPQIVGAAAVERNNPTRGVSTPAGRAAALLNQPEPGHEPEEDDIGVDLDAPPKRPWWFKTLGVFFLLIIFGVALFAGYSWTQTQYYLAPVVVERDHSVASEVDPGTTVVGIFRGIRQELGPVKLSDVHELSTVAVEELPTFAQSRVAEGITAPSLEEARTILAELQAEAE
ncbi:MAG TPA: serine/threonine-protein phosphatase, partial [Beutenbergiaceae bacterium]|nr:serine/threonine-protein phosphatase [Beutenbergiaceae bacterium]